MEVLLDQQGVEHLLIFAQLGWLEER